MHVGARLRHVAGELLGQRPPAFVEDHDRAVAHDGVRRAEGHDVLVTDAGGGLVAGDHEAPADPSDDEQPLGDDPLRRPGSAGPPFELHVEDAGLPADRAHQRVQTRPGDRRQVTVEVG